MPKPKYHAQGGSQGVTAAAARPHFSSSEDEDDDGTSNGELNSSDLDTDFSADESSRKEKKRTKKPSAKLMESKMSESDEETKDSEEEDEPETPSLKLKIKIPTLPASVEANKITPLKLPVNSSKKSSKKAQKRKSSSGHSSSKKAKKFNFGYPNSSDYDNGQVLSPFKLTINSEQPAVPVPVDTKLYCVCRSPHDEVSEMIGCDAPDCRIEWFHFECVGIMVPPEGQWYCPECTKRYNIKAHY